MVENSESVPERVFQEGSWWVVKYADDDCEKKFLGKVLKLNENETIHPHDFLT